MTQAMTIGNAMAVSYSDGLGNEITLDRNTVTKYITGGAQVTDSELMFFMQLCKARHLNPFIKEAYLVKYKSKDGADKPASVVVSKDVFTKRADLNPEYDGMEDGIIIQDARGSIVERAGTFYLTSEKLVGGWAKVYRKGRRVPTYKAVTLTEASSGYGLWKSQPAVMVNKVAIVRALRDAFPNDYAQMYSPEELPVDDNTVNMVNAGADDSVVEIPAEDVIVEAAPEVVELSAEDKYKSAFCQLKRLDGGTFTPIHKATMDDYSHRIKSGEAGAYEAAMAYMAEEIGKLEFVQDVE